MTAYLDHAATTPVLPEAARAHAEALTVAGNPSSLHRAGAGARRLLEEARESVAASAGADPAEVVFTSGGTEADNLAVKGIYWARSAADPARRRILLTGVEHHAVLESAEWLEATQGAELVRLPVDAVGRVDLGALEAELAAHADETALVTLMWANNEVGTLQPVAEAARLAHAHGVPLHTDAVQAFGHVAVDFHGSGVDALTLTGHKLGGPIGTGALLATRQCPIAPVLHGGGQERKIRSGTLDPAGASALAVAVSWAVAHREEESRRLAVLRDRLVAGVRAAVPGAVLRGDPDPAGRLASNAHFTFPGCEGDSLLFLLDAAGVCASTGSACTAGVSRPSHVLLAMGLDEDTARGALRLTLGRTSTGADVDAVLDAIGPAYARARAAGLARHEPALF